MPNSWTLLAVRVKGDDSNGQNENVSDIFKHRLQDNSGLCESIIEPVRVTSMGTISCAIMTLFICQLCLQPTVWGSDDIFLFVQVYLMGIKMKPKNLPPELASFVDIHFAIGKQRKQNAWLIADMSNSVRLRGLVNSPVHVALLHFGFSVYCYRTLQNACNGTWCPVV
jgi:hypothetical protein